MTDLFGHTNTAPTVSASLRKSMINLAHGFPEFWRAWPSGPRKVAKRQCLDKWARYECAEQASHIIAHVEFLKQSEDWIAGRVPMPLTYLNQQRWDGWEPVQAMPQVDPALAKIKADAAKAAPIPAELREKMRALRVNTNTQSMARD